MFKLSISFIDSSNKIAVMYFRFFSSILKNFSKLRNFWEIHG